MGKIDNVLNDVQSIMVGFEKDISTTVDVLKQVKGNLDFMLGQVLAHNQNIQKQPVRQAFVGTAKPTQENKQAFANAEVTLSNLIAANTNRLHQLNEIKSNLALSIGEPQLGSPNQAANIEEAITSVNTHNEILSNVQALQLQSTLISGKVKNVEPSQLAATRSAVEVNLKDVIHLNQTYKEQIKEQVKEQQRSSQQSESNANSRKPK